MPVEIVLAATGDKPPVLTASFTTQEDDLPRALPIRRFLLPWARTAPEPATAELLTASSEIPQLKGGNWARGRDVFFGEQAGCSKCHRIGGHGGGDLGPDLSNLVHRDYESVLRDIREPSGALNPDYIAATVRLKDGRVLHGIQRSAGPDRFLVRGDAEGEEAPILQSEVESVTPSAISLMPEALDKGLGAEKTRDLMTFLLTQPLEPAAIERPGPPPARTRAEIEKVLASTPPPAQPAAPAKRLNILLVAGPKDHGPSEHDYPAWQRRWATLLDLGENVTVAQATGWPSPEQWAAADTAVFYSANPAWADDKAKDVDTFLARGGGLVFIHFAVNGQQAVDALAGRIGLAWRNGGSKFRHGPVELTIRDREHPITRGFDKVKFEDETYWNLIGDEAKVHVLADAPEENRPRPLLWTVEKPRGAAGGRDVHGGRVFACILGHYTWTFDDPLYRLLILRGICWSANQPADRLNKLATIGARIQE